MFVKKMIYLSGMMDGVSIEEGNGWRKSATERLKNAGFDVYNPYDGLPLTKEAHEQATPNEVFHRDIHFLDRADVVLVNLDLPEMVKNKSVPFFTIGEMFLAHRERKPIVAFTNCISHRAGYRAIVTKTCEDLEACIDYIINNYS